MSTYPSRPRNIQIEQVLPRRLDEGETGAGLLISTDRGHIPAIIHAPLDEADANADADPNAAANADPSAVANADPSAVADANADTNPVANADTDASRTPVSAAGSIVWIAGARGGFAGPAGGLYAQLAQEFADQRGIVSLRLDYRKPNAFEECALDLIAGLNFLKGSGRGPAVIVGHSFGGAVVIAVATLHYHTAGVVALAPQTYGARGAGQLAPIPLLVVHGKADTRLPYSGAVAIHSWAQDPRQLVLYDNAEHRLDECRAPLADLLRDWIPAQLAASATLPYWSDDN